MPIIIENFDTITEDDILSYSDGQDLMPFDWELTNGELHLWGNTWKKQNITPVAILPDSVWQISVYLDNYASLAQTSEMQGFGVIDDQGNKLRYMFGGGTGPSDSLHWGEWVYQGAFPALQWNDYKLPISKDFERKYGYNTTIIETLFYYNDDDPPQPPDVELGMGAIWFDDVIDITDDLNQTECPPTIEIEHEELSEGVYQFNAILTHPCENFPLDIFWDFGDGTTSDSFGWIEHEFPPDDHDYTVFVKVTDNIGKTDWDSVNVSVPDGPSTFPVIIAWTGDVMFARRFECWDHPVCGDPGILAYYDSDYLFEEVKPLLDEADFKIINLETAVTTTAETNVHPQKSIPLRSHPDTLSGLVYAGIDYVSLANNHSGDYMVPGLEETIDSIKETGIRFSGAGFNSYDAYIPGFLNMNGVNFSIVSVSDRSSEYCGIACGMPRLNAGFNKLGFAYADIFDMSIVADEVSNVSDLTAVYLHAGPEYNQYPPVDDPSLARSSIDFSKYDQTEFGFVPTQWAEYEDYYPFNGGQVRVANMDERHAMMDNENLDILIAHHPHVLQGVELYNNKLIVHSLGNFIFDGNFPETMESAIFYSTIDLVDGVPTFTEYKFKPIYLDHYITKPAIGELGAHILDRHANLSRNIGSEWGAYLSVNKIDLESKVIISDDPATTLRQSYLCSWGLSNPVSVEDPWDGGGDSGTHLYQYDLIRLPRHGNISALAGDITTSQPFFKYRVGREILLMGNMEDEGSDLWLVNSNYEEYSSEQVYRGYRSLKHIRYNDQEGFVLTSLEKRFPIGTFVGSHDAYISWEAKSHSLHGAVKCYNCPPSDPPAFEIIYFQCRNGIPLGYENEDTYYSETINSELVGDTDWTIIEKELDLQTAEGLMNIPEGNKAFNGMYFNLRIKTWANTGSGDSTVYYDDVGIIEWEDWVVYENFDSLQIQNPNDYKYLQIRTSESVSGEVITAEELYYGENLNYSNLDPSPCSGACSCFYQGEFGE